MSLRTQSSFQSPFKTGTLFIVPTPIGNLEDITFRALHTLKEVDVIAAEDTRNTKKLLNHFEINKSLISYHEHNKQQRESKLIDILKEGSDIALVSDAGMPAISDPGNDIVQAAIEAQVNVVVLPGANAALCALVGSGLSTKEFYFYGFLPRKKKERDREMEYIKLVRSTILFYESPHRLLETLTYLFNQLGNRKVALARELTKKFEEYISGTFEEVMDWATNSQVRGEFCIVVEGNSEQELESESALWWSNLAMKEHVEHYIETGLSSKDAIKKVAMERNLAKREVYQAYHIEE